ncbi:MAG: acyltransferase [Candidatus Thermoplasmatota archaeon]|jgi:acetyltransferase-like isoleucine patch superfamily enzyme|nr:acyltransferase [Candidatus Thermoplasmatota archaeon]
MFLGKSFFKVSRYVHNLIFYYRKQVLLKKIGGIGRNVVMFGNFNVSCEENIFIGNNVWIGENCELEAKGGKIRIGNNCGLGADVKIISYNWNFHSDKVLPCDERMIRKDVVIGDHVFIGRGSCILPGVSIGEGAIIGMGSVVVKDIPPLAVAVGNPAKVKKYRDEKVYNRLKGKQNDEKFGRLVLIGLKNINYRIS